MMTQLMQVLETIREHAKVFWGLSKDDLAMIELIKVDVTVDMLGSFIPGNQA